MDAACRRLPPPPPPPPLLNPPSPTPAAPCQVNLKYLKKSARDEARAAFKQQAKAAKRAKLDPEQVGAAAGGRRAAHPALPDEERCVQRVALALPACMFMLQR